MKTAQLLRVKQTAVLGAMLYLTIGASLVGKTEDVGDYQYITTSNYVMDAYIPVQPEQLTIEVKDLSLIDTLGLTEEDEILLAQIAMAEAEGESVKGKALVMLVVLNRVEDDSFPDTIDEVILQDNPVQFTSTVDGRYGLEPNEECWEALEMIEDGWDESQGALYFESSSESTWHRENLDYLYQEGRHYFYAARVNDNEGKTR